jgi:hypothetical protein
MEHIQITYGVAILSFLGAIHWGFEFSKVGGEQGWRRLAIGVVPVLFAWPTTFLTHGVALAAQWAGFTGLWFLDQKATSKGWSELFTGCRGRKRERGSTNNQQRPGTLPTDSTYR